MLLAEDLLVLLVPTAVGELPRRRGTQAALGAAVLVELAGAGRLAVSHDDSAVTVVDPEPLGDEVLDAALAAAPESTEIGQLIGLVVPGLYVRLLDRLVSRGLLMRSTRPVTFGVASKHVWQVADHGRREELRSWLGGVVAGHTPLDQWSRALIGLLDALDALGELGLGTGYGQRIAEIVEGDWAADEVTKAVTDASLRALAGKTQFLDSVTTFPA